MVEQKGQKGKGCKLACISPHPTKMIAMAAFAPLPWGEGFQSNGVIEGHLFLIICIFTYPKFFL